jgi:hypothetical protein
LTLEAVPVRLREARGPFSLLRRTPLAEALPYELRLETPEGAPLARLRRGLALLRPSVEVEDPQGAPLGRLRQRLWAVGGGFDVIAPEGGRVAALREGALVDAAGRVLARAAPGAVEVAAGLPPARRLLLLAAAAAAERVASGR